MYRAIYVWIATLTMVTSDPMGIDFTEVTSSTGIVFVPFSKVQLSYKEWKLIYYYDLSKYYEEVEVIQHFYFKLKRICNQAESPEFTNNCHLAIHHAKYHIDKIIESKTIIDSYNSHKNRVRRSPFDIVGTLANSLFGVLDQEDADRYNTEIGRLRTDQNYQNELIKKHTLITERLTQSTNTSFSEIISKLNRMDHSLDNLAAGTNWSEITQGFNTMTATLALVLIDHDQMTSEIKSILSHTLRGEVIDLVPVTQLEENIHFIKEKLSKTEELAIRPDRESIYNIFKTSTVHSILRNRLVMIEIRIPILESEEANIFRAIPVPTQIDNDYVMILPTSDMFITNAERSQYIPLNNDEFRDCIRKDAETVICRQNGPIHNGEENTCELALLTKPYMNSLPRTCTVKTVPSKNYFIYLHEVNKFFCVIDTPIQFQVICPNTTDAFKMDQSGMLRIHNDCYIKSENFIIKSHSTGMRTNAELISPKFNLMEIIGQTHKSIENPIDNKSEIFIKDHFEDFNSIAQDISKLRNEQKNREIIEKCDKQITKLSFSTGGTASILILSLMILITLKIRKHFKIRKTTDIELQDIPQPELQTDSQSEENLNNRRPTPFTRRSLRLSA